MNTPTKKFHQYLTMTFIDRIFHLCIYQKTPTEKFPRYILREWREIIQWDQKGKSYDDMIFSSIK
jgi:hypothetical protein